MLSTGQYFDALYPDTLLKRLFQIETGLTVDKVYIREFRQWLQGKLIKKIWTHGLEWDALHNWVVNRLHEYSLMNY